MKSTLFPWLMGAELRTGITISLIFHLCIGMMCLLLPSAKSAQNLQIINITFPNESELLMKSPHSAKAATEKPNKDFFVKKEQINENNTETGRDYQPVDSQQKKSQIIIAGQTLSNDSVKQKIGKNSVSLMTTDVTITSHISPVAQAGMGTADTSDANDQKGFPVSTFGEKGAPSFIYQVMPVYPVLARRMGKEGKVILRLLIDMNGKLQNIEVVEYAGYGFTESAIEAVRKSTYTPGYLNGERVAVKAILPVSFHLQ